MNRRHFGNVRKLPSGRYQASYWHEGQRHVASDTFRAKADGLAHLSKIETELRMGSWLNPDMGRITVEKLAALWLRSNSQKRPSTRLRDEAIVRLHVLPRLGNRILPSVTLMDIQSLVDHWSKTKAPSTVVRQPRSPLTSTHEPRRPLIGKRPIE